MEANEQINQFTEFIEKEYYPELLEKARKEEKFLAIDFKKLAQHSPELADLLLEEPEEVIKAAEIAIEQVEEKAKNFSARFKNLSETARIMIRDIRSKNINKFSLIDGVVRNKSEVRPQVTSARFECPSCGTTIAIIQLDTKFKEPMRCSCGRKGKFKLLSKELVDAQMLVLEEVPEQLDGGEQPKRMNIFLKNDLVSPLTERKTNPGSRVIVSGIIKEVPIMSKSGGQSTRFDLMIEANYMQPIEQELTEIKISEEDLEKIKDLSQDPQLLKKLTNSIAPTIYGHDKIKEALVLQIVGGVRKQREDGSVTRGDIHVLLVGDPGAGKSMMLKRIAKISPKARFISGKGASGTGLCVAGDSLVMTNPGEVHEIKNLVEDNLKKGEKEYIPGIFKSKIKTEEKTFSLNKNGKIETNQIDSYWKIKAPNKLTKITTQSGKEITTTHNTKLYTLNQGEMKWKESNSFKIGEYIATSRKIPEIKTKKQIYTLDLIQSNPTIYGVKNNIKRITQILLRKHKTKRDLAKQLNLNENNLYHNWINKRARGNINLTTLRKLMQEAKYPIEKIKNIELSLYKGHKIKIPHIINEELLYFAGLIAGDGDLSKSKNTTTIRFSSDNKKLLKLFEKSSKNLFNAKVNISSEKSEKRPASLRFGSKIVAEIMHKLGIPPSPKSNLINPSNIILQMPNKHIAQFLRGLFDCDGSVILRKTNKSHYIDLTTTSKELARKVQLALLRFEISSKLRIRKAQPNLLIKSKYDKYVIEIKGKENLIKFKNNINFNHDVKKTKLNKIINIIGKPNTNIDIIPDVQGKILELIKKYKIKSRQIFGYKKSSSTLFQTQISRNYFKKLVKKLEQFIKKDKLLAQIKNLAFSDLFWEKIISTQTIENTQQYIYDLTVKKNHNFLVNGIIVHNTATVVKDEFLQGWSLEAGALVLANKGVCCIDELDKMSNDDRAAMHEALEGQSYHYNTEITFADGKTIKIGDFVENLMNDNRKYVVKGINCEFLFPNKQPKIITTDFNKTYPQKVLRISRHKAPEYFIKIKYSNGREIIVTPEHPIFVFHNEKIREIPAILIRKHMLAPAPRILKIKGTQQKLKQTKFNHFNNKKIEFPKILDKNLARLLGYIISEGHSYYNPNTRYAEIGISNTNKDIIKECQNLFKNIFNTTTNTNLQKKEIRKKATKDLYTVRCCSIPLYHFFKENFSELIQKANTKRTPIIIKRSKKEIKINYLQTAFKGDGTITNNDFGYSTSSYQLAKDYQDLLLNLEIESHISTEKRGRVEYYKVLIRGIKSKELFLKLIVNDDKRKERIEHSLKLSKNKLNQKDPIPTDILIKIKNLLGNFRLDNGYFNNIITKKQNSNTQVIKKYLKKLENRIEEIKSINKNNTKLLRKRANIQVNRISKNIGVSNSLIYYKEAKNNLELKELILRKTRQKILLAEEEIHNIKNLLNSEIRFLEVVSTEKYHDKKQKMVYDITVAPHQTFVSEGLILHNTITISKANIQATLRCETTVLAAANPKFGRFDPYDTIANQINLPVTLINRFDLIFPIKDLPDEKKDEKMASFILELHKETELKNQDVDNDLLRKYIAYSKQNIIPQLTTEAITEIKEYFLKMRASTQGEGTKIIPISARQLEGLIRLSEASARIRLSDKVTQKDAKKAVELLDYCLRQVAFDQETGTIDIDRIATEMPAAKRNKIITIKEIIVDLENKVGKTIPLEDVIKSAQERGMEEYEIEELIQKLKRAGDIFEPRRGFISRI